MTAHSLRNPGTLHPTARDPFVARDVQLVRQERQKLSRLVQDDCDGGEATPQTDTLSPAKPAAKPPAAKARLRPRHIFAVLSFVLFALAPPLATGWYMWNRAHDRFISTAGFSVRAEEAGSALELLGGVAELSGASTKDSETLYQFITSPEIVAVIDDTIDLRAIWGKADRSQDPIFAFHGPGTIEDLTAYWQRMIDVYADNSAGLIDVQVQAFSARDAQLINQLIYDASLTMINRLSDMAREDATAYARADFDVAVNRLREARAALTLFRNRTQIVDPAASIAGQLGIMTSLQSALAEELIEFDILAQSTTSDDRRLARAQQRIDVIQSRITQERAKFGVGTAADPLGATPAFADLIGDYERLAVDLEVAEGSYRAAQIALDAALTEARRQSRYLAAHIRPTLPERAQGPDRMEMTLLVALFSGLIWGIGMLSAYALRDRR